MISKFTAIAQVLLFMDLNAKLVFNFYLTILTIVVSCSGSVCNLPPFTTFIGFSFFFSLCWTRGLLVLEYTCPKQINRQIERMKIYRQPCIYVYRQIARQIIRWMDGQVDKLICIFIYKYIKKYVSIYINGHIQIKLEQVYLVTHFVKINFESLLAHNPLKNKPNSLFIIR